MGIRFCEDLKSDGAVLVAGWQGVGNIGLMAVNYLLRAAGAREVAEIEPWDFFLPRRVVIQGGILRELEFPSNKFHLGRIGSRDLLFFVAEQRPGPSATSHPAGRDSLEIASLVLDVARRCGCRRLYVLAAGVAPIHHSMKPRVWAVPNDESLIGEIAEHENAVLMSEVEGIERTVTGPGGLLMGLAKRQGVEAICLMGEIPFYLRGLPVAYPKSARSILEVLAAILAMDVDLGMMDKMVKQADNNIEMLEKQFYQQTPPEMAQRIKGWLDSYKSEPLSRPITEDDSKWLKAHIEELFRREGHEQDGLS